MEGITGLDSLRATLNKNPDLPHAVFHRALYHLNVSRRFVYLTRYFLSGELPETGDCATSRLNAELWSSGLFGSFDLFTKRLILPFQVPLEQKNAFRNELILKALEEKDLGRLSFALPSSTIYKFDALMRFLESSPEQGKCKYCVLLFSQVITVFFVLFFSLRDIGVNTPRVD